MSYIKIEIVQPKEDRRMYFAKPFEAVIEGKSRHSFEWFDNVKLQGSPLREIPLTEPGKYKCTWMAEKTIKLPPKCRIHCSYRNIVDGEISVDRYGFEEWQFHISYISELAGSKLELAVRNNGTAAGHVNTTGIGIALVVERVL